MRSPVVTSWNFPTQTLYCSGNVPVIKLWDLEREFGERKITTGVNAGVTKLWTDQTKVSFTITSLTIVYFVYSKDVSDCYWRICVRKSKYRYFGVRFPFLNPFSFFSGPRV